MGYRVWCPGFWSQSKPYKLLRRCLNWVAVEERKLSYYIGETIMLVTIKYTYIYIYIHP